MRGRDEGNRNLVRRKRNGNENKEVKKKSRWNEKEVGMNK